MFDPVNLRHGVRYITTLRSLYGIYDTRLYITDCGYDLSLAKRRVECCVNDIHCWMVNNGLKFSQDKTDLVLISSKSLCMPSLEFIQVVEEKI